MALRVNRHFVYFIYHAIANSDVSLNDLAMLSCHCNKLCSEVSIILLLLVCVTEEQLYSM